MKINKLYRCNWHIIGYFILQIRDLAAKLAVRLMDLVIYDLAARLAATILNAAFYFIYDIVKIHYKVPSIKHFEHYTSKFMAHLTLNLSGATASHDASPMI